MVFALAYDFCFNLCHEDILILAKGTAILVPIIPRGFEGNRDLKHRRRGRQREHRKTIVLMSKTLTLHVHYTLWYISLPSSAKQRREMTNLRFYGERERMMINFRFSF